MSDHRRCARLAAWGSAWLAGTAAFDQVLDAVTGRGRVVAGPGFEADGLNPVGVALTEWRRAGSAALRLVLPVPGDVRGLAGPAGFRATALDAGQAVFGNGFGVTVVAGPVTPSSAGRELVWHRAASDAPAAPFELASHPVASTAGLADAEYELAEAIRQTASEFTRRGATSWLTDIAPALSDARRAGERLHLPASHPARAVRLIAQAERLTAVFSVLDRDDTGAVTAGELAERSQALAPLRLAVRQALLAGYNAPAEVAAG
ncbi:MAG TPA: hypothetical protein VHO01_06980 [Jatrophihabitans sp.]|nr:hypothetical protein [Jatrophihabitans sp.]